jgi:hypothetical protein
MIYSLLGVPLSPADCAFAHETYGFSFEIVARPDGSFRAIVWSKAGGLLGVTRLI